MIKVGTYIRTPEIREKQRLAMLGKPSPMKGKRHSLRTRKTLSEFRKGFKVADETKKKISVALAGRVFSEEHKRKIGLKTYARLIGKPNPNRSGSKSNFWKGGITDKNRMVRDSLEYKKWRKDVFERDDYTCVFCGARNGEGKNIILNADHIKPFSEYPELRFVVANGRTLCSDCHRGTPTFGRNAICLSI